jgi:UDPglucose 6-dehydrogenase
MRIAVYGLWHLGCVCSSCAAAAGHQVVGFDPDSKVVHDLQSGQPPLYEPGLAELITAESSAGRLRFTTDPADALRDADVLWMTIDTPVNEQDEADVARVRGQLEAIVAHIAPGTLVMISSQLPVGFTPALERDWHGRGLRFAYSPENLRLGKAIECFQKPDRVIIGVRSEGDRQTAAALFAPYAQRIEWMSVESAEMTKHAINAFLAASVTFINELARLCEAVGADAKEVERGLKSESRIGPKAYVSPGAAFAGGTLARDLRFLAAIGKQTVVATPLFDGVLASNAAHMGWLKEKLGRLLEESEKPVVAVLGLTYKPGTSTLRRSASVELCRWLQECGAQVRAHDPAVHELPEELRPVLHLCSSPEEALTGAAGAVVATEWPDYRGLQAEQFVAWMQQPRVIDPNWFLAGTLAGDRRITYLATGRPQVGKAA